MNREFSIVVVGAGMVGLTVAALLQKSAQRERIRLHIVDAGQEPSYDVDDEIGLRVSAISLGSAQILSDAGAWPAVLETRVCPYRSMRVWDSGGSVDGPEALHFESAEFSTSQLGHIVENSLVQTALIARLRDMGQTIDFNTPLATLHVENDRHVVQLADGRSIFADLVIGADGGASFVRESAGISVERWPYSQTAFVTHLRPVACHQHTAWQRFLRSGPVALLPLHDGRVSTVWSTTAEQARIALEAPDDELTQLLGNATDDVLGRLIPAGPRGTFPLRGQHADNYVLQGLALVGDAAHSVHPLAGQGVNLGLADAESLAKTVVAAVAADEHPGDLPVLRRYERARKGANRTMLHFVDGINRLFRVDSNAAARLRGGGMRLFNSSGLLRQRVVQVALGISR